MKDLFVKLWLRIRPAAKISSSELQKNIEALSPEDRRQLLFTIEQINGDDALRTADAIRNIEAIKDLHFLRVIEAIVAAKIKAMRNHQ